MYDVIVIGGGPAGSQAARLLARRGLEVVVLEKGGPDHVKCCAGALSGRALPFLEGIQLPPSTDLKNVELIYKNKKILYTSQSQIAKFVVRSQLDQTLREAAQKAGALIRYQTAAQQVRLFPDRVEVEVRGGKVQGRYLVGADGATGITRRLGSESPKRMAIGLEGEIFLPEALDKYAEKVLIDISWLSSGYAWLFPKKDRLSVGIVSFSGRPVALRKHFQRFIDSLKLPSPKTHLAHPLPALAPEKLVIGRCLLAGDATSLVDRFSGEGIAYALHSGTLAAEAIASAWEEGTSLESYQELVEEEIYSQLKITSKLQKAFWFWPWLSHFVLRRHPSLMEEYFSTVAGQKSYAELAEKLKQEFVRGRWLKRESQ